MKLFLKISLGVLVVAQLQSCIGLKNYQRPSEIDSLTHLDLFRPEYQSIDSNNIADLDWNTFFTDPFLKKYIEKALKNNLDFAIAEQQLASAASYYQQATQSYFPTISIAPGASYQTQSLNTQFGQIIGERRHIVQYDITGSLSWEADIWGKITAAKRSSMAEWQRSMAAKQAVQTTLIANLASTYYQLLVLDEQKKLTTSTIQTRLNSLETTKALKDAGTLTEVAVQQSEALVYNAQALLINIDQQIHILENTFQLLLGESPKKVERMRLDQQNFPSKLAYGVPYQLLHNRPDIRAAEYNLWSTFELTNVAKANFYPAFRITGSTGLQSIQFDQLFSPNALFANIVGNLTQPIWNRRTLKTQKEIAEYNQTIAFLNYKKSILTASKEISDALINIESQEKIISLKEKESLAYKKSTDYSQELVNYGLANYLEVLRSQENELSVQLALLNAKYAKLNAIIQLYKALGGGWRN